MKTKKVYEKPMASVEEFVANEYVGYCAPEDIINDKSVSLPHHHFLLDKDGDKIYNSVLDGDWVQSSTGTIKQNGLMYYGWRVDNKNEDVSGRKYDAFCMEMVNGQWAAYEVQTVKPNRS